MDTYQNKIEDILNRDSLGIYELMKYHFAIKLDNFEKSYPYANITKIFSNNFGISEQIYDTISLSIEFLNASFEVHEDVRNGNTERLGRESLWWKYGPAQAINVGDGFQALSRSILLELVDHCDNHQSILSVISKLDDSIIEICEAENLELKLQEAPITTLDDYKQIIESKFGALLSNCLILPSIISLNKHTDLRDLSNKLVVFEKIRRDVEFFEDDKNIDSPQFGSILSKSKPLPVIFAMKDGTPTQKRMLGEIYLERVIDPQNINKIKDICNDVDSVAKSKSLSDDYKESSLKIIKDLKLISNDIEQIFLILQNI